LNSKNGVHVGSWLIRLIAWDGLLPGAICAAPFIIRFLVPNSRTAIEFTAVVLPIAAFFARYQAGRRLILLNNCGLILRRFQYGAFYVGIFLLVLIEAVIVLTHVMPKGALFAATEDLIVWAVLYSSYLTAMAVAMYPGRYGVPGSLGPLLPHSRQTKGPGTIQNGGRALE
jgi:hypothetical protein